MDHYVLGYRQAEQQRLQHQAEQLGHESARLFDEIGILEGARVLEIGCGPRGCLDLLSARVGASGRVVGVEISAVAVALAQTFLTERGLHNVEVIAGDAHSTGLPEGSFDLVTSRLVLVLVPQPEQDRVADGGGAGPAWRCGCFSRGRPGRGDVRSALAGVRDTVEKLFMAVAEKNGNDFYLGRKLPRSLREAGLVDVRVKPIVHIESVGNPRRSPSVDFLDNMRDRILALHLVPEGELSPIERGPGKASR